MLSRSANGALDDNALAELFAAIALAAAVPVMNIYACGPAAWLKPDQSPVTEADERSEEIILERLSRALPGIPVLAEEAASKGRLPAVGESFILVDPLDGTREFLSHNGEFTINIALVRDHAPVCGAVFAPAVGRLWFAGDQAFETPAQPGDAMPPRQKWRQIRTRAAPERMTALSSRSHLTLDTKAFLARLPIAEQKSMGSSLKFCVIAGGEADVAPRFGPTMEWDTAAGDAILRTAGGMTLDANGQPLRYGKEEAGFRNSCFIAWGDLGAARAAGNYSESNEPKV